MLNVLSLYRIGILTTNDADQIEVVNMLIDDRIELNEIITDSNNIIGRALDVVESINEKVNNEK